MGAGLILLDVPSTAESGGLFELTSPLLTEQIQGQTEKDMKKMKEILEKGE